MEKMDFIGIDFGTTNTSIAKIRKEEYGLKKNILTEGGEHPFASLLAIDSENHIEFGNTVKQRREYLSKNGRVISSFKTLLGTDKTIKVNGDEYTAVDLVAKYLECLKKYVKQFHDEDIENAAFSFPVGFSPEARRDLREAAKRAGINITHFVSESTAAYLATCEETRGLSRVMVVDWGGGTLDISILEKNGSKLEEIAVCGEKIGGDDIDRELAERVHAQINMQMEDKSRCISFDEVPPEQRDELIHRCEHAKIQISEDGEDYRFRLGSYCNLGLKMFLITNEMFEDIVKPIIRNKVIKTIESALNRAELSKGNIDAVIIAGGSSNLRLFADAIENIFGADKIIRPEKFQFVSADGAAMMPIIGGNFKLNDDVGIMMSDDTVFPVLRKDKDGVGSKSDIFTFSLVEDSPDAHFIITNGDGRIIYDKIDVPTKGFLKERLILQAEIDCDQIANIHISSDKVPDMYKNATSKIGKLTYYYDLSDIES